MVVSTHPPSERVSPTNDHRAGGGRSPPCCLLTGAETAPGPPQEMDGLIRQIRAFRWFRPGCISGLPASRCASNEDRVRAGDRCDCRRPGYAAEVEHMVGGQAETGTRTQRVWSYNKIGTAVCPERCGAVCGVGECIENIRRGGNQSPDYWCLRQTRRRSECRRMRTRSGCFGQCR